MRKLLTRLFWPILRFFETGEDAGTYKTSHRVVLVVVGLLFVCLALGSGASFYFSGERGALIPLVVFSLVGTVALVVGSLGSNGAVSKIWGTR